MCGNWQQHQTAAHRNTALDFVWLCCHGFTRQQEIGPLQSTRNTRSDVFNHKHNGAITDMKTQTKAWLAKALPIVDGTATECPPNFRYPGGGLCYKHDSDRNNGAQCGQSSAVKWCALSQTDFEDKTNEFGNCGSFCFACGPNDEMLTNRRIAAY